MVNISVLIPSRGRPEGLARCVKSMARKVSGKHNVQYVIGCDGDDLPTIGIALGLRGEGLPVIPSVAARQPTLGGLTNMLAAKHPADVYVTWGDDFRVLTERWDDAIADAWVAKPDGVWWWRCEPQVTLAIISEKWRAAAGRIYTDYFPFWYDDIWLIEVLRYATGSTTCYPVEAWIKDGAAATHRMRDLAFWDDFFWSRRDERKAEARRIAERLGWPVVTDLTGLDVERATDFDAAAIEARQGDKRPPTAEYMAALERAKSLMEQKEAA